jgi:hypothetical protein
MAATIVMQQWGEATCNCPSHNFGEGFAPIGSDQLCTEIKDRTGRVVYVGDIVQRYPLSKYPYSWEVKFSSDEGFGLPDDISPDIEVIGHIYEDGS